MVNFTIFTGGYTSYILTYLFNSETSSLTFVANTTTGPDPSWLTLNTKDRSLFYAVNEVTDGALQSYKIESNGSISLLNTVSSEGNGPAFAAALPTGEVAIMNYGSGNGRVIDTTKCGTDFDNSAPLITFPPPAGGVSNPHMAVLHNDELFVTDLGGDKVWRLGECSPPGNWSIHGFIEQPKGSGPRHMAIRDDYLYVLHETASTLSVQKIPSYPNGTSPFISVVSVVPTDGPSDAQWFAAELLIPPTTDEFPIPYIYASNRNIANRGPSGDHDPRGDPIAIFEHVGKGTANETLELIAEVYTGLEELRGVEYGFDIWKGGEKYIVALGAQSGGMVVFERVDGGRGLKEVARDDTVVPRSTLLML